jgi:hypothetical protein
MWKAATSHHSPVYPAPMKVSYFHSQPTSFYSMQALDWQRAVVPHVLTCSWFLIHLAKTCPPPDPFPLPCFDSNILPFLFCFCLYPARPARCYLSQINTTTSAQNVSFQFISLCLCLTGARTIASIGFSALLSAVMEFKVGCLSVHILTIFLWYLRWPMCSCKRHLLHGKGLPLSWCLQFSAWWIPNHSLCMLFFLEPCRSIILTNACYMQTITAGHTGHALFDTPSPSIGLSDLDWSQHSHKASTHLCEAHMYASYPLCLLLTKLLLQVNLRLQLPRSSNVRSVVHALSGNFCRLPSPMTRTRQSDLTLGKHATQSCCMSCYNLILMTY